MPTYSYKCQECETSFEVKATIQEKEEGTNEKFKCPKCDSKKIQQVFSLFNFIRNIFSNTDSSGCCSSGENCCESKTEKKDDCCCSNGKECCKNK